MKKGKGFYITTTGLDLTKDKALKFTNIIDLETETYDFLELNLPEERLLYAILNRAIHDLLKPDKMERPSDAYVIRKNAYLWIILSDITFHEEAFSFAWICEILNLNPHVIRDRVLYLMQSEIVVHQRKVR